MSKKHKQLKFYTLSYEEKQRFKEIYNPKSGAEQIADEFYLNPENIHIPQDSFHYYLRHYRRTQEKRALRIRPSNLETLSGPSLNNIHASLEREKANKIRANVQGTTPSYKIGDNPHAKRRVIDISDVALADTTYCLNPDFIE